MRAVIAVLLLTLSFAGCGGSSNDPSRSSGATTTTAAGATKAELEAMLLTADELGPGWEATDVFDDDDSEEDPAGEETPGECDPDFGGAMEAIPEEQQAEASFVHAQSGVLVVNGIAQAEGADEAQALVDEFRQLVGRCAEFEDAGVRGSMAAIDLPSLGDSSFAARIQMGGADPFAADFVVVAEGRLMVLVGNVAQAAAGVDRELTGAIAEKAAAKLA